MSRARAARLKYRLVRADRRVVARHRGAAASRAAWTARAHGAHTERRGRDALPARAVGARASAPRVRAAGRRARRRCRRPADRAQGSRPNSRDAARARAPPAADHACCASAAVRSRRGCAPTLAALRARSARALAGFRDDLPELMPGFDLLVHPAVREGLGVALLEAASCALPIVAAAAGGVVDVLEHERTALLVPPADAAALARGGRDGCSTTRDRATSARCRRAARGRAAVLSRRARRRARRALRDRPARGACAPDDRCGARAAERARRERSSAQRDDAERRRDRGARAAARPRAARARICASRRPSRAPAAGSRRRSPTSPGSSQWFEGGVVAYSNAAKSSLLGVPAGLLAAHGAVSEPVVRAMAEGARARFGVALAVAVSGDRGAGRRHAGQARRHRLVRMGDAARQRRPRASISPATAKPCAGRASRSRCAGSSSSPRRDERLTGRGRRPRRRADDQRARAGACSSRSGRTTRRARGSRARRATRCAARAAGRSRRTVCT